MNNIEPEAWVVDCPTGHEFDSLVFFDKDEADLQAELFNDDYPEGEFPHTAIPLCRFNSITEAVNRKGIIDCTGPSPVVRDVLGTLPKTKDGAVVGDDARVWSPSYFDINRDGCYPLTEVPSWVAESRGLFLFYSTLAAADKASETDVIDAKENTYVKREDNLRKSD